jgi:antitoxin component HigA of HigAB toxin-antitoxin module
MLKKWVASCNHSTGNTIAFRKLGVHRTLGAMILRGQQQLTLQHVRTLVRRFHVSADLFLP